MGKDYAITLKAVSSANTDGSSVSLARPNTTFTGVYNIPNADGLKLKAVATDATFSKAGFNGAALTLENKGKFALTYNVASQKFKGEVSSKTQVLDKPLDLKLAHDQKDGVTTLDTTYTVSDTKLNAKYNFNTSSTALKVTHVQDGITFEPSFDMASKDWSMSAKKAINKDSLKVAYNNKKKISLEYDKKPAKFTLAMPADKLTNATFGCTFENTY